MFKLYLLLPLFEREYWNTSLSTFSDVLTFLFVYRLTVDHLITGVLPSSVARVDHFFGLFRILKVFLEFKKLLCGDYNLQGHHTLLTENPREIISWSLWSHKRCG